MHFSLFDVTARFNDLEPAQILDGFVRTFNGVFNGVLDGSHGGADEFDKLIDWVFHKQFFGLGKNGKESPYIISHHGRAVRDRRLIGNGLSGLCWLNGLPRLNGHGLGGNRLRRHWLGRHGL